MIQEAIALHQQGLLEDAERLYTQILQVDRDHFDALHLLGVLMHQRGNCEEALDLIAKALATNPGSADAHANQARMFTASERYDLALASNARALALQPNDVAALCDRAKILNALSRLDEALATYDGVLALRPGDAQVLNDRGVILQKLERYNEAIASYDRALSLQPLEAVLLFNRGNTLAKMSRFEEALADYDRAVYLRPDYAEVLNNRGRVLMELDRFDEASASYDRALALRPDYAEAENNRGSALTALGWFNAALASFDRVLAVCPEYVEALCGRGNVLHELEQFDESLASYQSALALRPNDAEILNCIGRALATLDRLDEALTSYDRALASSPDCPEVLCNRGLVLQDMNFRGTVLPTVKPTVKVPERYIGYYINLDRSIARREEIEADIARHGLQGLYRRFPAADGNILASPIGRLTHSEIGCFTSHYLLLKQSATSQMHLHVVEDDVVFSPCVGQAIESVIASGAIDQFDMLFTETLPVSARSDYKQVKKLYDNSLERDAAGNVSCIHPVLINYLVGTTSYIVNYRSVPRLLEILERELMNGPIEALDLVIRRAAAEGAIRIGCLFPFVTALSIEEITNTTIADRTTDRLGRLARGLVRHSFFVSCDHKALSQRVVEALPLGEQSLHGQATSDADAHSELLDHIFAFSKTENYKPY